MQTPLPARLRLLCGYVAILALGLLTACPGKPKDTSEPGGVKGQELPAGHGQPGEAATASYPEEALGFLQAGLKNAGNPAYPNLGQIWQVIALCPGIVDSLDVKAAELRAAVGKAVSDAGEKPPPELVRAWLSTHPENAKDWIARGFATGNGRYLVALPEHEALGRELIAGLDGSKLSTVDAGICLDLLRSWGSATETELPLLRGLASRSELDIRLRASGWLLKLGDEPEKHHKLLWDSVRAAKDKLVTELAAAAEAVRISGDGTLSDAFAPLLVQVKMGEETVGTEAPAQQIYCAYAASFLPGEGAATVNRRLLEAVSPRLRWEGAIGLLLSGDASAWDARLAKYGADEQDMWTTLAAPEVRSVLLLPTYERAAQSEKREIRGLAAAHLNRYGLEASDTKVAEQITALLVKLSADSDKAVAGQAFFSAGMLKLTGLEISAGAVLKDSAGDAGLRWAACTYLMRRAEAQP